MREVKRANTCSQRRHKRGVLARDMAKKRGRAPGGEEPVQDPHGGAPISSREMWKSISFRTSGANRPLRLPAPGSALPRYANALYNAARALASVRCVT